MKKVILASAVLLIVSACAFAQRNSHSPITKINSPVLLDDTRSVNDTLRPASYPGTSTLYTILGGGYVCGTNGFMDLEKMQKYGYAGGTTVSEILVFFGAKEDAASPGNITGKVYSVKATNFEPDVILGSVAIPMTAVDTSGNLTPFVFITPVAVADSFFVGFEMSTVAGDTVGAVSNTDPEGSGFLAWDKWGDGTWHMFNDSTNWRLNIDMYIFPVVNAIVGMSGYVVSQGLSLGTSYPNPAVSFVTIPYTLDKFSKVVNLKIIDVSGRIVNEINISYVESGNHTIELPTNNLASGNYYYMLRANGATITRKMTVVK